jgi:hypothetical protein
VVVFFERTTEVVTCVCTLQVVYKPGDYYRGASRISTMPPTTEVVTCVCTLQSGV